MDITHGSNVTLDNNSITQSITPTPGAGAPGIRYYTSVGSSDATSTAASATKSQATFSMGAGNALNVNALGVITNISGTGTLTAQTLMPQQPLVQNGPTNQPYLNFTANGTFQLNGPGMLWGITSTGANQGTFIASLANAGQSGVGFMGPIGAGAGNSLNTLTFNGAGLVNPQMPGMGYDTNIVMMAPGSNIWSTNVNLSNAALHAPVGAVTINSTNFNVTNAILDASNPTQGQDNNTITVAGGALTLSLIHI